MSRRSEGLFAGRGISWRTLIIAVVVVILAFAAGIAAGWGSSLVPELYRSATAPSPTPTPTPTPSPSPSVEVSLGPLAPISRELTADDAAAGVTSVDFTRRGEGSFTTVSKEEPVPTGDVPVRLVRIDVEDGLDIDGAAFNDYVMGILNDPRGWGSEGRMQFVQTEGVPDLRLALASPYTTAAKCPDPHARSEGSSATGKPTPDTFESGASPTPSAGAGTCADRGTALISEYDWIAGLPGYGDDVVGARRYLVSHATGHVLGEAEGECAGGEAMVMVEQREPMDDCAVNPWPYPDAPVPFTTPSTTAGS